jgi:hypothetical protein
MDSRAGGGGDQPIGRVSMDVRGEAVRWRARARVGGLMQGGRGWGPFLPAPSFPGGCRARFVGSARHIARPQSRAGRGTSQGRCLCCATCRGH